jgi:hypothetical protein
MLLGEPLLATLPLRALSATRAPLLSPFRAGSLHFGT